MFDTPVISPISGHNSIVNTRYSRLYNNPMFDYLSEMLPTNIKDLFKWCELVYHSVPVLANGIRKLVNYPVTNFSYVDESENTRTKTKELVEKLHLKSILLDLGTDRYVYGNGFRTVYFPFKRFLKCKCGRLTAIEQAKFTIRKKNIILECSCGRKDICEIEDVDTNDVKNLRIVRWDPKQIELVQNPITGATTYYYAIPPTLLNAIQRGDITVMVDTPKLFIEAALQGRNVKMGSNFFHSKTTSLSGYASGWGISPLTATLKTYMYMSVLKKSSEAIGMEHITPQRILFPQTSGTSDPSVMGSMKRWKEEVNTALDRWRIDPNYVMTAPFPTGVTNIGSQGRALSPIEEIKDARQEMAMAIDIPPNVLMGDATIQASAISLRMLENQLTPTTESLQDFANWVIDIINAKFSKHYCHVDLVPFRLADDMMNKQLLLQAMGQAVSKSTVLEALNLDPDDEHKRLKDETLKDNTTQREIEQTLQQQEQNAAAMAQDNATAMETGQIPMYNQQKMIAMAQEQAQQLMTIPYEERRSVLAQLQNEDYVMYCLVSKQLEMFREDAKYEQGGQPPQG